MRQPLQASFSFAQEVPAPRPTGLATPRAFASTLHALDNLVPRPVRPRPLELPSLGALDFNGALDGLSDQEVARRALEAQVAVHLPDRRLILSITDNRYTMISVKRGKGLYRLRLHHMFLDATPEVVRALGRYTAHNDRHSSRLLGEFIDEHQNAIRPERRRSPRLVPLCTAGRVHELGTIYDGLNRSYFDGQIDARITWGQRSSASSKRRRRSIKMGSYSVEDRLIRIHPSLDRAFVPRLFVEWIVYHEMLHQKHDIPVVGGRRQFHTPAFLIEEAAFAHYDVARRWERENLDQLLAY